MSKHNLEPKALFGFFDEICSIPHPSKHEEQISAYLQEFGKKLGYETIADEAGAHAPVYVEELLSAPLPCFFLRIYPKSITTADIRITPPRIPSFEMIAP